MTRNHGLGVLYPQVEAMLFDLDGTLADTEEDLYKNWREMFADRGVTFTPDDYRPFIGSPEDRKVPELLRTYGIDEDPAAFYARFVEGMRPRLSCAQARPGAAEALAYAKSTGAAVGLVTSAPLWHAKLVLDSIRFPTPFHPKAFITADAPGLERLKPHPDPYLLAAKRLGVKPGRCVAFEDTVIGATAARDAGLVVIAVPHRFSDRAALAGIAHHVVPEGQTIGDVRLEHVKDIDALLPRSSR